MEQDFMRSFLMLACSSLSLTTLFAPAFAQNSPAETPETVVQEDDFHTDREIVVTAPYGKRLDILAGTSALAGAQLAEQARGQIGETLTGLPGVSATSFSPGASRPVLRGFQGGRVAVLTDGIGNIDASNTSADHAVTIESLTAERIEVLRGPAVLLFGGQAVGGAVNVIDKRIPRAIPKEAIHIDGLLGFASANGEYSGGVSLDAPIGDRFVVHVDGSYRDGRDLRTGGFVIAPVLRAQTLGLADAAQADGDLETAAELRGVANKRGRIPGTFVKTWTAGGGAAFINDGGNLGVSFNIFDTLYGIPARPGGESGVSIDLKQYRFDLRGAVELGDGIFDTLKIRTGYANYRHQEIAGGELETLFLSKGIETRIELLQNARDGWNGASGIQYQTRDFEAIGEEAFVPPNSSNQFGIFTLQEFGSGRFGAEASLRYDHTQREANTIGVKRGFSDVSAALGVAYTDGPIKIGANISRTGRAPSAEELFSDGPHLATQAFEIGDPNLKSERSWNGEVYVRYDGTPIEFSATLYANRFKNFIYEDQTGEVIDGLPVFQIVQSGAQIWGAELEATGRIGRVAGFDIETNLVADLVRAELANNGGNLPRIPALRLLGGLGLKGTNLDLSGEVEWTGDQRRVAQLETATNGATVVNASATWRPWGKARSISLIASANNIFDVSVRRAASFTKDFAPLAGRDIRLSARFSF
jgi:iron complex outermembrane recepter protein